MLRILPWAGATWRVVSPPFPATCTQADLAVQQIVDETSGIGQCGVVAIGLDAECAGIECVIGQGDLLRIFECLKIIPLQYGVALGRRHRRYLDDICQVLVCDARQWPPGGNFVDHCVAGLVSGEADIEFFVHWQLERWLRRALFGTGGIGEEIDPLTVGIVVADMRGVVAGKCRVQAEQDVAHVGQVEVIEESHRPPGAAADQHRIVLPTGSDHDIGREAGATMRRGRIVGGAVCR